jgi:hypothetical protein
LSKTLSRIRRTSVCKLTKENSCVSYWIFHATVLVTIISAFHNLKPSPLNQSQIYINKNVIRHALKKSKPKHRAIYKQEYKNLFENYPLFRLIKFIPWLTSLSPVTVAATSPNPSSCLLVSHRNSGK